MVAERRRVGIIGANPDRGWGSGVHRVALGMLPELTLSAVCTTRQASAEEAKRRFRATHAFTDGHALIECPDVDLVSICVLASHHYELTMAAIAAGKSVYCEWPFGLDLQEATEMANAAAQSQVRTSAGLHMRALPAMRFARSLIRSSWIGEVLSLNLVMRRPGVPPRIPAGAQPILSRSSGTTLQTIHLAHMLDAVRYLCGPLATLQAEVLQHVARVAVVGTSEILEKDTPDQVIVMGRLASGGGFAVDVASLPGVPASTAIQIVGADGMLELNNVAGVAGGFAAFEVWGGKGSQTLRRLAIPAKFDCALVPADQPEVQAYPGMKVPRETLVATAGLYRAIFDPTAIEEPPTFAVALELMRILQSAETAARSGTRIDLRDLCADESGP